MKRIAIVAAALGMMLCGSNLPGQAWAQGASGSGGAGGGGTSGGAAGAAGGTSSAPSPASTGTPGSVSTSQNPGLTAPINSPGSEGSGGTRVGGSAAPGTTPELERKSQKIDREIKKGICTGC